MIFKFEKVMMLCSSFFLEKDIFFNSLLCDDESKTIKVTFYFNGINIIPLRKFPQIFAS